MILVVDNYDSFTFNLVHYLMELGAEVLADRLVAEAHAEQRLGGIGAGRHEVETDSRLIRRARTG